MITPKISVVIPVYNTEEYIEQCINSLLSQTYTNIEIICVNDGSPDNCPKILDKYKQIDNRVVVHNQENKGQSVARNKGVEISTGNWITFVDSDDWVGVDCYQKFYEALNNSDYFDIFMFNGTCFTKDENNLTDLKLREFFNLSQWNKKNGEICSFKDCKSPFEGNLSVYNKIYRREFIQRNNLKFKDGFIFEDELYWVEAFIAASSIYLSDETLYFYRQQQKSTMHTLNKNIFNIFPMFNIIKDRLIQYNYYNMSKYAFLQHRFRQYAWFFFNIPQELRPEFYQMAQSELMNEVHSGAFDINILRKLKDNILLFDFINISEREFFNKYQKNVRVT